MKIITIVGIRKSGKTSTVTALVEAIRRRGKRVERSAPRAVRSTTERRGRYSARCTSLR